MIPVTSKNYIEITYENIAQFRDFKNRREKKQYWNLLKKEVSLINDDVILKNANKLYFLKIHFHKSRIAKRCCDFQLLEEKCFSYNKISEKNKSNITV